MGLPGRFLPPERLADQQQPARGERGPQEVDGAGQPAADPGRPDAGDRVERRLINRERAGLGLLEPDPVGDAQVSGPVPRGRHEDLAEVHPQALDPVPPGPGAQHLALAAAQVEQPLIAPPPAQLAQEFQLLVRERVQDPVARLGYLMLAQDVHGTPSAVGGPRGSAIPLHSLALLVFRATVFQPSRLAKAWAGAGLLQARAGPTRHRADLWPGPASPGPARL